METQTNRSPRRPMPVFTSEAQKSGLTTEMQNWSGTSATELFDLLDDLESQKTMPSEQTANQ